MPKSKVLSVHNREKLPSPDWHVANDLANFLARNARRGNFSGLVFEKAIKAKDALDAAQADYNRALAALAQTALEAIADDIASH
jgi:hypothetical protein